MTGRSKWRGGAVLAMVLVVASASACAPMEGGASDPAAYPYEVTLPAVYDGGSRERFPLIVYLHGAGGATPGTHPIAEFARDRPGFPFIVVAPRTDDDWDARRLAAVLREVRSRYRVDPDRIYLTGISRGAFGAFRFAAAYPDRFAALALVAGGGEPENACRIAHLPVRFFHNRLDPVVPPVYSEELAAALRGCGAVEVRVDIFDAPASGHAAHDAWTAAYGDPGFYAWLLGHRRGGRR